MANLLKKQPKVVYTPSVQGVAYKPEYCYSEDYIKGYTQRKDDRQQKPLPPSTIYSGVNIPAGASPVYGPDGQVWWLVPVSTTPVTPGYIGSSKVPVYGKRVVCIPEVKSVPGIPGRIDYAANNGWNGGARSIEAVPVDGYFEVILPDNPVGVIVGLSDGKKDHSYGHASHAAVFRPSGVTPIEYGFDTDIEHPLGKKIRIVRTTDSVITYVDGVLISRSSNAITGEAYVDVSLYAVSDFVDSPSIGEYHESSGESELFAYAELAQIPGGTAVFTIQSEAVVFSGDVALSSGMSEFRILSAGQSSALYSTPEVMAGLHTNSFIDSYGVFYPGDPVARYEKGISYANGASVTAGYIAEASIAKAAGYFSRPTLEARINRPEAEVVQAVGVFPQPMFTGNMLNGAFSSAESTFCAKGVASEGPYFGGIAPAATKYQLVAWEPYEPDDQMDGGEQLFSIDNFSLDSAVLFFINEGMQISSNLDLYLIINLEAYESVCVGSGLTLNSVIEMMIRERVAVAGSVTQARKESIQYAVNAISGALSLYENFGFKQFATAAGKTYAVKDDGLYVLTGGTDNGNPLSASIDFGASDFGVAQSKRLSTVFAGIATDGDVYLRVSGDGGQTQVYRAISRGDEAKATTAKGLVARHWRVKLELMNASYADVDNLEIEIGVSQRRQSRGR